MSLAKIFAAGTEAGLRFAFVTDCQFRQRRLGGVEGKFGHRRDGDILGLFEQRLCDNELVLMHHSDDVFVF